MLLAVAGAPHVSLLLAVVCGLEVSAEQGWPAQAGVLLAVAGGPHDHLSLLLEVSSQSPSSAEQGPILMESHLK